MTLALRERRGHGMAGPHATGAPRRGVEVSDHRPAALGALDLEVGIDLDEAQPARRVGEVDVRHVVDVCALQRPRIAELQVEHRSPRRGTPWRARGRSSAARRTSPRRQRVAPARGERARGLRVVDHSAAQESARAQSAAALDPALGHPELAPRTARRRAAPARSRPAAAWDAVRREQRVRSGALDLTEDL